MVAAGAAAADAAAAAGECRAVLNTRQRSTANSISSLQYAIYRSLKTNMLPLCLTSLLCLSSTGVIEKAAPFLKSPNPVTRQAVAGLCHNVCVMDPSARERMCRLPFFAPICSLQIHSYCLGVRDVGGLQLLMALLMEEGSSYGEQVAAMSALAVCALSARNKRVMVQLSALEAAWRVTTAAHELAVEAICCVCSVMMDDGFVPLHITHNYTSHLTPHTSHTASLLNFSPPPTFAVKHSCTASAPCIA
jgi:hypothetical protein